MEKFKKLSRNKHLDLPEIYDLKNIIKEQKVLIGKLLSDIDDLTYKNGVLIKKGKELEQQVLSFMNCSKQEKNEIRKSIRSEETYKNLHSSLKASMDKNKAYKKEIKELMYKLIQLGYNNPSETVKEIINEKEN